SIDASHVLIATGRKPNTDDLGLDASGVVTDKHGYITVDDRLATNVDGIWALGDCNGHGAGMNVDALRAQDIGDRIGYILIITRCELR
ncbi:FAD-dependent oxidoreductase, partial [Rhizobium ruizarguesonis]